MPGRNSSSRALYESQLARAWNALWTARNAAAELNWESEQSDLAQVMDELQRLQEASLRDKRLGRAAPRATPKRPAT